MPTVMVDRNASALLPFRTPELDLVLLITTSGSQHHAAMLNRMNAAGLPPPTIINATNGHVTADCLRRLHNIDPSVTWYNRSRPVDACGLKLARRLHISPPVDPWVPWPHTRWIDGELRNEEGGQPWTAAWGEYGCAVSHAQAWRTVARRRGELFSLIMEDDVIFAGAANASNWYEMLKRSVLPAVPQDAFFLYVGYCQPQHKPHEPLIRRANHWCSHGYAVTPRGARRLLTATSREVVTDYKEIPTGARWKVKRGIRVPIDFVFKRKSENWLNAHDINEARAARDNIVDRNCFSARADRSGGIMWQDPSFGSRIWNSPKISIGQPGQGLPTGLKWRNAGTIRPTSGQELINKKLAKALETKSEFTKSEWDEFGKDGDLPMDGFIMSGSSHYFTPASFEPMACGVADR